MMKMERKRWIALANYVIRRCKKIDDAFPITLSPMLDIDQFLMELKAIMLHIILEDYPETKEEAKQI